MAVVDTNVILHGRGEFDFEEIYLIPEVIEEVESSHGRNVTRNLDYSVSEPKESSVSEVTEKAKELNSPTSEVDERVLALALELDDFLITDDKALQNLALHLGVVVNGFHDPVLDEKFKWVKKCDNCGNEVSSPPCPRCGSRQIRRKQVRCS
jgi:UPF0271 protein